MSLTPAFYATWSPRLLGLLRIILGFLYIQHGTAKLFGVPHVAMFDGLQLFSLMGAAGVLELVGGALLLLGLFTRPVAFILSGQMAVAYFLMHAPSAFLPILNGGEMAVMYCFSFLYFAAAGAGAYSLDDMRGKAGA
ncbi:DoxX family membrane protein [Janthinobacterium sp. SUN073]|uniref:DoxX family protein n=1 Tax=Janthinobacterium sp. SUN073 TaxID=3004102 RepID=UPI0025AF3CFB|nr:DoxX family membrane protein [Janthinobacterium sp. SUN073]MDN2697293.1 DoxX family membrane protein [Janthinobacterium sp. SUN073]